MPIRLSQGRPEEQHARIEIIPLIDIMFFLLAAFMLVSLSMVHLNGVPVNLPTATTASPDTRRDFLTITVDREGVAYLEGKPMGLQELSMVFSSVHATNPGARVYLSGDQDARHGDIMGVLDLVRATGVQKVAFEIKPRGDGVSVP
jgi:biopolymer transport protein ExbD